MTLDALLLVGSAEDRLAQLSAKSFQCCVTSPPYWGLRDYGVDGQYGLERTPQEYVAKMVRVFRGVRRALCDDGTLWLNIGDSSAGSGKGGNPDAGKQATNAGSQSVGVLYGKSGKSVQRALDANVARRTFPEHGIKAKDLIGIPWMLAFALRADGWYLRSDIIWHKPNPMPESVRDRPTRAHEMLFLLSKSAKYYYDADAIAEPSSMGTERTTTKTSSVRRPDKQRGHSRRHAGFNDRWDAMERSEQCTGMRNRRDVWTIAPSPFRGAHFATFPPLLVEPCILAGSRRGDTVLDPFCGSGTVGVVALKHGRDFVGVDISEKYIHDLSAPRIAKQTGVEPIIG